jgi:leucyl aminopeptidase
MNITTEKSLALSESDELVVLLVDESRVSRFLAPAKKGALRSFWRLPLDEETNRILALAMKRRAFKGSRGQTVTITPAAVFGSRDILVIGTGPRERTAGGRLSLGREIGVLLVQTAQRIQARRIVIHAESDWALAASEQVWWRGVADGLRLSSYRFDRYRSKELPGKKATTSPAEPPYSGVESVRILGLSGFNKALNPLEESAVFCQGTQHARDLVNTPARDCTPTMLRDSAKELARKHGLEIEIFDQKKLGRMGAHTLLSVAQGSEQPPYLIRLTYRPRRATKRCISLVGKGVTFDTGGYSLKTASGMESMKIDMSGAAAVLGAISIIAGRGADTAVRVYIPTVENMISGRATRPGDVVTGISGKSIEILNTDAEGRLILSDALTLAERDGCDQIIDVATLTGACIVALGTDYAGLFCDDDLMAKRLIEAAQLEGELLWRMPLAKEYRELIKGNIADIKNIGGPYGGAITAALFLKEFVGSTPWAHLDIAGPASSERDKGILTKGGTGVAARTLARYVIDARGKPQKR